MTTTETVDLEEDRAPLTLTEIACRMGAATREISAFWEVPAGTVVRLVDGSEYVIVPEDAPDALGRTGVLWWGSPPRGYSGPMAAYAGDGGEVTGLPAEVEPMPVEVAAEVPLVAVPAGASLPLRAQRVLDLVQRQEAADPDLDDEDVLAAVCTLMGCPPREVDSIAAVPAGVEIRAGGGVYLVVPLDRPDAEGKTGLMYRAKPALEYDGTFPVYVAHGSTKSPAELRTILEVDGRRAALAAERDRLADLLTRAGNVARVRRLQGEVTTLEAAMVELDARRATLVAERDRPSEPRRRWRGRP